MLRILLIDDNRDDRSLAARQLKQAFAAVQVTEVGTAAQFKQALAAFLFDVVITDYQLGWSDGLTILKTIKAQHADCPVIMFTNTATQEIALAAMKSGLNDYVVKSPSHYVRLPAAVTATLEHVAAQQQAASLQARIQTLLNQLDVGVYRLTSEGALLEGNAAFFRLLGLTEPTPASLHQTLNSYFSSQDYTELLDQLHRDGEVRDREIQLRRADGTVRWVKISKTLTRGNRTTFIDGLIEDISDRKQLDLQKEREQWRSQFLAEAGRLLGASLNPRLMLDNVAALAIAKLADICVIDLTDAAAVPFAEPIIAATDPEKRVVLLELRRRYPPIVNGSWVVHQVVVG